MRELLGLGPAYYHGVAPASAAGATKFDGMWAALFDGRDGPEPLVSDVIA